MIYPEEHIIAAIQQIRSSAPRSKEDAAEQMLRHALAINGAALERRTDA